MMTKRPFLFSHNLNRRCSHKLCLQSRTNSSPSSNRASSAKAACSKEQPRDSPLHPTSNSSRLKWISTLSSPYSARISTLHRPNSSSNSAHPNRSSPTSPMTTSATSIIESVLKALLVFQALALRISEDAPLRQDMSRWCNESERERPHRLATIMVSRFSEETNCPTLTSLILSQQFQANSVNLQLLLKLSRSFSSHSHSKALELFQCQSSYRRETWTRTKYSILKKCTTSSSDRFQDNQMRPSTGSLHRFLVSRFSSNKLTIRICSNRLICSSSNSRWYSSPPLKNVKEKRWNERIIN